VQQACTADEQQLLSRTGVSQVVRCRRASELEHIHHAASPLTRTETAADGAPLLAVRDLSASYGSTRVLTNVSLEIGERECLAIVGESGSGKTTLARCVVGLHPGWSGSASLHETALPRSARERDPDLLRQVQYIFQNPYGSLNPRKTIGETVGQPLAVFGLAKGRDAEKRVGEMLEQVSLSASYAHRYPDQLSGGERQRVAIARALISSPAILICDEVTSALDVSVQAAIVELLGQLQRDLGLSMVFVTHNLPLVRSIAQKVVVLSEGSIVEYGDTAQVLADPQQPYTQQLIANTPSLEVAAAEAALTEQRHV
jgi:peptide/nickel transport system ATP-binding protein